MQFTFYLARLEKCAWLALYEMNFTQHRDDKNFKKQATRSLKKKLIQCMLQLISLFGLKYLRLEVHIERKIMKKNTRID